MHTYLVLPNTYLVLPKYSTLKHQIPYVQMLAKGSSREGRQVYSMSRTNCSADAAANNSTVCNAQSIMHCCVELPVCKVCMVCDVLTGANSADIIS